MQRNQLKMPLACGTLSYREVSLERALQGIAASGFKAIELGCVCGYCEHVKPEEMTSKQIAELRSQIERHELIVSAIAGHIDLKYPLLGKGEELARQGYALLKSRIDLADALGAEVVNTGIGVYDATQPGQLEGFYQRFGEVLDYAAEKKIKIGLESHEGLTETAGASLELCDRMGRENLGLNYDAANVRFYTGLDPVEDMRRHEKRLAETNNLVHVHIKDHAGGKGVWDFPPLGEGQVDFEALTRIFKSIGFKGPYSLEIEFKGPDSSDPTPEIIDQGVADSYQFMKSLGL